MAKVTKVGGDNYFDTLITSDNGQSTRISIQGGTIVGFKANGSDILDVPLSDSTSTVVTGIPKGDIKFDKDRFKQFMTDPANKDVVDALTTSGAQVPAQVRDSTPNVNPQLRR